MAARASTVCVGSCGGRMTSPTVAATRRQECAFPPRRCDAAARPSPQQAAPLPVPASHSRRPLASRWPGRPQYPPPGRARAPRAGRQRHRTPRSTRLRRPGRSSTCEPAQTCHVRPTPSGALSHPGHADAPWPRPTPAGVKEGCTGPCPKAHKTPGNMSVRRSRGEEGVPLPGSCATPGTHAGPAAPAGRSRNGAGPRGDARSLGSR